MSESSDYFDTPQRTERMHLLMHLVSNAEEIPYLRAPQGAGKTRFARALAGRLKDDYTVAWLTAGGSSPLRDQLGKVLDLPPGGGNWPADALDRHPDRPLLLIVDDAERLQLAEVADLLDLARAGARLLLVGTGELAQARGNWDLQFVDLPPFTEAETRAFLEARGRLEPGEAGARTAATLHRACEGLPGLLLDALDTLPVELPEPSPARGMVRRPPWGMIAAGLALLAVAGLALYFQDRINAWLEPAGAPEPAPAPAPVAVEAPPEPPILKSETVVAPQAGGDHRSMPPAVTDPGGEEVASGPGTGSPPSGDQTAAASDDSEAPDPVLDAIIEEAIRAAAQPPEPRSETAPTGTALAEARPDGAPGGRPAGVQEAAEGPAPVGETPTPAATTPEVRPVAAPPAAARRGRSAEAPPGSKDGLDWLRSEPAGHYTLQLLGARDRKVIDRFVRRHEIPTPHAVFERSLDGRPWYSLVAGSYPDRDAAVAARARLPAEITKAGAWPRTFGSIREQMKGAD